MKESRNGLIAVLLVALSTLCVVLVTPLYIDNYILQSLASDLYRFGKIPYMGSSYHDFPGMIGVHYIAILFFGTKEIGFRVFDVIVQIGFVMIFYRLLLQWLRPRTAALAVVLYILYYVGHGASLYGQRDVYLMMLIFASFFLLLSGKNWIGLAGLLAGLAVLLKPTAFFDLALLALYVLLNGNDRSYGELRSSKRSFTRSLIFVSAGIFPLALVLIYYSSIPGGLEAFYLSTIRFNLDIYTKFHTPFHDFAAELGHYGLLLAFASCATTRLPFLSSDPNTFEGLRSKKDKLFLFLLIASNLLIVIVQRKFIPYHFAPFFMSVIPLAAIGI